MRPARELDAAGFGFALSSQSLKWLCRTLIDGRSFHEASSNIDTYIPYMHMAIYASIYLYIFSTCAVVFAASQPDHDLSANIATLTMRIHEGLIAGM